MSKEQVFLAFEIVVLFRQNHETVDILSLSFDLAEKLTQCTLPVNSISNGHSFFVCLIGMVMLASASNPIMFAVDGQGGAKWILE